MRTTSHLLLAALVLGHFTARAALTSAASALVDREQITLASQTADTSAEYPGLARGNGLMAAVTATGHLVTSPDGLVWTERKAKVPRFPPSPSATANSSRSARREHA